MSFALRSFGSSLACLGLSFACATAQDDPFLQGAGGRVDTAGKGGGGATAGTAGQTGKGGTAGKGGSGGSAGASGSAGKGGASGSSGSGAGGNGGNGGTAGNGSGNGGDDAGGTGGAPESDPCAPEGTPPEIHVLLQNDSDRLADDPKANFRLVNDTDEDMALADITLRYYFTSEFKCARTLATMTVRITYFHLYNPQYVDPADDNVITRVVELEERGSTCDAYFELGFADTTPTIMPGGEAAIGFYTEIPIYEGPAHDQSNDFSFGACTTKRAWWDRVTVYDGDERVSGTSPDNDPVEGGAGGAGGQGGQAGQGGLGGEAGEGGSQGGLGGAAGTDAGGTGGLAGEGGGAGEGAGGAPAGGAAG